MNRLRSFAVALWLALALLAGQQAAALHDLSHATEQLGKGVPAKHSCDQCFLSAQLSGAMAAHVATAPVVAAAPLEIASPRATVELPAPRLSFRSRAPPTLL